MLNYSAKKIQFDDFILDSVHQSRPIQIIPFNKSDFDISSFIEFADSITIDYICYYKAVRKNSFIMYASHVDLHQDFHPCIIVKIKFEDSKYKVYVQDEIRRIKQSKIDDENCLTFKAFSTENNQVFYFENHKWDSQFPYKDSVLYNFGNYAAKKNTCAPIFLKYTFDGFLNQKTHNRNKKFITVYDDFIKILEHLPGFVYMEYSAIKEEPQLKHKPLIMNIDNKKSILASLAWIMPWAEKVSKDCHYIEIDGSYKACEPYHYCIFHGIIYNNSLPFAVTLFPSECSELFDMLFVGLQKHHISKQNFENKPTLSDLGSAIKKFCADHGMSQNLCHRHLIENIGSSSIFGLWASKILKIKSLRDFLKMRKFYISEITTYHSFLKNFGFNTTTTEKSVKNLLIMLIDPEENVSPEIKKSNYYLANWAIWMRRINHVGRCSNHCEGCHANINQSLSTSGQTCVRTGFSAVVNYLLNYLQRRSSTYGDAFKNKHEKIIIKLKQIFVKGSKKYLKYSKENCSCEDDLYNESIFGVRFPCIHQVLYTIIHDENFITFQRNNLDFDFNEFALICLDTFQLKFYNSAYKDTFESNKNIHKILNQYANIHPTTNKTDLSVIINAFIDSLSYTLPEFYKVDDKDRTNVFLKEPVKEYYPFNETTRNPPVKAMKVINDKHMDWFDPGDDPMEIMIKIKYNETVNEIISMYPKMENPASICFNNFMKIIFHNNDRNSENIPDLLALMKIQSWKDADEKAKSNKFFHKETK